MDLGENFRARVRIARFGSQGGTHEHKQLRIGLAPSRRNETRERRPEGVDFYPIETSSRNGIRDHRIRRRLIESDGEEREEVVVSPEFRRLFGRRGIGLK